MTDERAEPVGHDVLLVEAKRDGGDLIYRVTNCSARPVWAFLLVPSLSGGKLTFAQDAAWLERDGDLLVVRKVDTPVPDDVFAERIRTGALELAAGAGHAGRIALGPRVEVRGAYDVQATHWVVSRVVVEVGWLPVREGQTRRDLTWDGQPFAYLHPEIEPGGQRLTRSPIFTW